MLPKYSSQLPDPAALSFKIWWDTANSSRERFSYTHACFAPSPSPTTILAAESMRLTWWRWVLSSSLEERNNGARWTTSTSSKRRWPGQARFVRTCCEEHTLVVPRQPRIRFSEEIEAGRAKPWYRMVPCIFVARYEAEQLRYLGRLRPVTHLWVSRSECSSASSA